MSERTSHHRTMRIAGWLGLGGCVAAVAADALAILLYQPYNPISQTVSSLAAGRWAWIMDTGLVLLAAGMAAAAVGLLAWRRAILWVIGCLSLGLMAPATVAIALASEYTRPRNPGLDIHEIALYGVLALGVLTPLLLAPGLLRHRPAAGLLSIAAGVAWAILGPLYWYVPGNWVGAYERGFLSIGLLWLATVSNLLRRQGRMKAD